MTEPHKIASEGSVEQSLAKDYVPKSKLGNLPMPNQINDALFGEGIIDGGTTTADRAMAF